MNNRYLREMLDSSPLSGTGTPPPGARVAVAMSGGVDSSVVAALYAAAGYEVVGLTMQLYDHGAALAKKGACCAGRDIHDARRVAERMGFAHYVLDYESRFRESVIDGFADDYLAGRTPVPCIRCNQGVKFTDLIATAKELGAHCLATGHYIRRIETEAGVELWRGADSARDQSWFLFATTPDQLAFLRFPLGGLASKAETRALAARFGLPVADKPDSQDICFVPNGDYAALIRKLRPESVKPGEIVDETGAVLGRHEGVIGFTIGQRRGLGIAAGEPLYVVRIEPETHRVVVGPRAALETRDVPVTDINWLGDAPFEDAPAQGWPVEARIRSTRPPVAAHAHPLGAGRARVSLAIGEQGVAPGQACVFYQGERVLGGGWIARA